MSTVGIFQQLTVSTFTTFIVAFKVLLLAYGDAGKSLSRHISMLKVLKPREIEFEDWIFTKFPTVANSGKVKISTIRRSTLHIPKPSFNLADPDTSSADVFAELEQETHLIDSLSSKQRFDLAAKFDSYISGLEDTLDLIYAKCFTEWFSPEVIVDIKASAEYARIAASQDIFYLRWSVQFVYVSQEIKKVIS